MVWYEKGQVDDSETLFLTGDGRIYKRGADEGCLQHTSPGRTTHWFEEIVVEPLPAFASVLVDGEPYEVGETTTVGELRLAVAKRHGLIGEGIPTHCARFQFSLDPKHRLRRFWSTWRLVDLGVDSTSHALTCNPKLAKLVQIRDAWRGQESFSVGARVLKADFVIDGLRAMTSLEDLTTRVAAATGIAHSMWLAGTTHDSRRRQLTREPPRRVLPPA